MSHSSELEWIRNAFSESSSTEDIALFMSKLFTLESRMNIDVVKSFKDRDLISSVLPVKIDITDGLHVLDFILMNMDAAAESNGIQVLDRFVSENRKLFEKYNINVDAIMNIARTHMKSLTFPEIMHAFSVYEQKRNRQMLKSTDLCEIVKSIPGLIRPDVIAAADLLNELASLCITSSSKAEIKIHINSANDVRISIDTASMLHNIREGLMRDPVALEGITGKTFSIEISNKLVKNITNQ